MRTPGWITLLAGALSLAADLPVAYLMLIQGVAPGTPISLGLLVPAMGDLIRALMIDGGLLITGIVIRACTKRGWASVKAAQSM